MLVQQEFIMRRSSECKLELKINIIWILLHNAELAMQDLIVLLLRRIVFAFVNIGFCITGPAARN